ncbi:MAG: hypothetical protein ACREUM_10450, partial [Nitrosospira sp.]
MGRACGWQNPDPNVNPDGEALCADMDCNATAPSSKKKHRKQAQKSWNHYKKTHKKQYKKSKSNYKKLKKKKAAEAKKDNKKGKNGKRNGGKGKAGGSGFGETMGDWAGMAAQVLGYVTAFLCQICAILGGVFGAISVPGYLIAGMVKKALVAAVGVLAGAVAGAAGKAVIKKLVTRSGGKMIHLVRHMSENGQRVLRYVPTSMRVRIEWVVAGVVGLMG